MLSSSVQGKEGSYRSKEMENTDLDLANGQEACSGMTAGRGLEEGQREQKDSSQEQVKQPSEGATTDSHQDSGLGPSQDASQTSLRLNPRPKGSQERMPQSSYTTSTPKKKLVDIVGESDYGIISSQMILEDPMLSSIDEPSCLTDHQAESLTSDEEGEELSSRFHTTQIRARLDASQKEPHVYKLLSGVSNTKVSRSQSLPDAVQHQHVMETSTAASVKKNLFDIPISPKLKNRVRERLYTLVNSIEGYEDQVYLRDEDTLSHSHNIESLSKNNIKSPKSIKMGIDKFSRLSGHNSLDVSNVKHKSFHDHCSLSALNSSIVERYECALSSIVASQLQSFQYHQEQLNQERLTVALQKKEQEVHVKISMYQEKLKLMTEMVEELKLKFSKHQATAREDAEHYEQRLREQKQQHWQELTSVRDECHKKIEAAETHARLEAAKNCEQRIAEVLATTRLRAVVTEKEHEAQISNLNSTINKLRAEKKVLEVSLEDSTSEADRTRMVASTPLLQTGMEVSQKKHGDPSDSGSGLQGNLLNMNLLKKQFQEEIEFWKRETERLQMKQHEGEVMQGKLVHRTFQDLHSRSKTDLELLKMQKSDENDAPGMSAATLQEQLSQAEEENIAIKKKLTESQRKEADLSKRLSVKENEVVSLSTRLQLSETQALHEKENLKLQLKDCEEKLAAREEQQKQTMQRCQLDMEKERLAAASAALTHQQEKTRLLLADLRKHYEEVIRRIQAHSRAQISEYKKAVRYLKQQIKVMEKG